MHPYATDSRETYKVAFILALAAVGTAFAINGLLGFFNASIPWWLEFPGPFGIYGLYVYGVDRFAWRWRWVQALHIITVPNLNGTWNAILTTSHDNFAHEHRAIVTIEQRWSSMMIRLQSKTSNSFSLIASILLDSPKGQILSYQYQNDPTADASDTMQIHTGTAWLELDRKNGKMEGHYYTDRGRENHGTIVLTRAK